MSLVGTLEELGLGEIFQIVSLSRKTGVLSLTSRDRDGTVFFRQGLVVRATSSTYQQSLGEVLIQRRVIDLSVLRKALALQQENHFTERLGAILINNFGVSQDVIEEVVREQIENVVFSLFAWKDGNFRFVAQDTIDTEDGAKMDPLQFMLDQGLNPQFLAMEGTIIVDENRHAAGIAAGETAPDFARDRAAGHCLPVSASIQHHVVIVDDNGPTLQMIADGLTASGFVVHAMTRSEDALIKVDSLHRADERPAVLIDLIMPKMDGSGVLGGMELLELLHNNFKDLTLMVMTDYHHPEAEQKILEHGYPVFIKPRRVEITNPDIMGVFNAMITNTLRHSSDHDPSGKWQDRFNLGDELRSEMGEDSDMPLAADPQRQTGTFSLLRGMLEELNNPDLQGGVLLLVLRFASEFVNRAIIFTVNDRIISGFGQFGITGNAQSGDDRVRSIHFPQESDSMFNEPLRTCQSRTFSPEPTQVDSHIFEQLGGGVPSEIFIGPLISRSRVIGFLYGDNLPEKKLIGDIEPLAIFLAQAGIAIEKSLLERQLQDRGAM